MAISQSILQLLSCSALYHDYSKYKPLLYFILIIQLLSAAHCIFNHAEWHVNNANAACNQGSIFLSTTSLSSLTLKQTGKQSHLLVIPKSSNLNIEINDLFHHNAGCFSFISFGHTLERPSSVFCFSSSGRLMQPTMEAVTASLTATTLRGSYCSHTAENHMPTELC